LRLHPRFPALSILTSLPQPNLPSYTLPLISSNLTSLPRTSTLSASKKHLFCWLFLQKSPLEAFVSARLILSSPFRLIFLALSPCRRRCWLTQTSLPVLACFEGATSSPLLRPTPIVRISGLSITSALPVPHLRQALYQPHNSHQHSHPLAPPSVTAAACCNHTKAAYDRIPSLVFCLLP
jgi:hypothetical protein